MKENVPQRFDWNGVLFPYQIGDADLVPTTVKQRSDSIAVFPRNPLYRWLNLLRNWYLPDVAVIDALLEDSLNL